MSVGQPHEPEINTNHLYIQLNSVSSILQLLSCVFQKTYSFRSFQGARMCIKLAESDLRAWSHWYQPFCLSGEGSSNFCTAMFCLDSILLCMPILSKHQRHDPVAVSASLHPQQPSCLNLTLILPQDLEQVGVTMVTRKNKNQPLYYSTKKHLASCEVFAALKIALFWQDTEVNGDQLPAIQRQLLPPFPGQSNRCFSSGTFLRQEPQLQGSLRRALGLLRINKLYRNVDNQLPIEQASYDMIYLTLRVLMSYIYMEHPFLMFLDHTQRRSTVGRTPLDE